MQWVIHNTREMLPNLCVYRTIDAPPRFSVVEAAQKKGTDDALP
jgi:hypothetical protein